MNEGLASILAQGLIELSVARSLEMVDQAVKADGMKPPTEDEQDWVVAGAVAATAQTMKLMEEMGMLKQA